MNVEHGSAAHLSVRRGSQDEVDRLVAAWRRERPDLDVGPLEVLSRVTRLARHLERARRATFSEHELDAWEFDVLAALRRSGEPYRLSPGQLVSQTLVTSGTMTNRIDRLADKGMVQREPDPSDRRGVLVVLTPRGRDQIDSTLAGLLAQEQDLLGSLPERRREILAGLLRDLIFPFDNPPPDGAPSAPRPGR
jgi:DNA-binding MarR family transcriptional regulator